MAKFLDAGTAASCLEELITRARERLVLINPQLKLSGRSKELLERRGDLEVRIVFGKCELHPAEIEWLRRFPFLRTHFARGLTAKCYLNEEVCIVTSLDLFDFGQVMNHEMGVLIERAEEPDLYHDAAKEADRILASSEELRIRVESADQAPRMSAPTAGIITSGKVSTHRLAKKLGLKTHELLDGLERLGAIEVSAGQKQLTAHGIKLGGEFRSSMRFGNYFVWPANFELSELAGTNGHR